MRIINTQSLATTVESISEAFFFGRSLSRPQKIQAAKWIAGRQGKPGSYADMFAPTRRDLAEGIRLFTGEKVVTKAGARHILGEEACRALVMLKASNKQVSQALQSATVGMLGRLRNEKRTGMYCCGKCSVALWRHLTVGGLKEANPERLLHLGVKRLKEYRDGQGKWRAFPFYYTLLALNEINLPSGVNEMQYAAASLERLLKRSAYGD